MFEFAPIAGVVSEDASEVVCKTEIFPVNAGIASSKAESINVVAAAIVIFDKIVCDPRGWKAVLAVRVKICVIPNPILLARSGESYTVVLLII